MYSDLLGIKIEGKMFETANDFQLFNKISNGNAHPSLSVVYGRNGSGKSTIAKGFRSFVGMNEVEKNVEGITDTKLIDKNGLMVEPTERLVNNIFVFDEYFIDEKVKIKRDGLDTIVMFGDQANIDTQIVELEKKILGKKSKYSELMKEKNEYDDCNSILSPDKHYQDIEKQLKGDDNWAGRERIIKGHKSNAPVSLSKIKEIGDITLDKSEEEIELEYQEKINIFHKLNDRETTINEEVILNNYQSIDQERLLKLLSTKIESPELSNREQHILHLVEQGSLKEIEIIKTTFDNPELEYCPLCLQHVSEEYKKDIVQKVESILSEDVEKHRRDLYEFKRSEVSFDSQYYEKLDKNLINTIIHKIKDLNIVIESYNKIIEQKIDNVFTSVNLEAIHFKNYEDLFKDLNKLEEKRKEYNQQIQNKDKLEKELIELNKNIAHYEIKEIYKHYIKQKTKKDKITLQKESFKNKLEQMDIELQKLNEQYKNTELAVNFINNGLKYIFFSDERLFLEARSGKYVLHSKNKPVLPQNISKGERNALALCYYFTEILNNLKEEDIYKNGNFLILDDPISSFDLENQIGILSYLKLQFSRILNGNERSKILLLSHDLQTVDNIDIMFNELTKQINNIKKSKKILNNFTIRDFENNDKQNYKQLLFTIFDYADYDEKESINPENNYDLFIGNIIRRFLEAFSTFQYQVGIDQLTTDKKIINSIPEEYREYFENLMYRIVLNQESHLRDRANLASETGFFDILDSKEKRRIAQDILVLVYILNPLHIKSYFKNVKSIEPIKRWKNNIK